MTKYSKSESISWRVYWRNNFAKINPDPIWNDGVLGFSSRGRRWPQQEEDDDEEQKEEQDHYLIQKYC